MTKCERCGEDFARKDNRKYRCDVLSTGGNQVCKGVRLNSRSSDDFTQDDFREIIMSMTSYPPLMVMNFVEINH